MMSGVRERTKEYREEKKYCGAKRKHERSSLNWQGDGEIYRKKKGIAREYETRKDRQRSENQFVCSLVA